MFKYYIIKEHYINLPAQKVVELAKKYFKKIDDVDVKQTFIEECVGNVSASSVLAFVAFAGGGITILSHPVIGTIIVSISIAYGSILKVYSGRYYRLRYNKKHKILPLGTDNHDDIEKGVKALFKQWASTSSMKYLRTNTSKYGFIRLLSKSSSRERKKVSIIRE